MDAEVLSGSFAGSRNTAAARAVFLFVLLGTGTQCAPSAPPPALPVAANVARVRTEFVPPTWVARFEKPTGLTRCEPLESNARLCVGELGERWLDDERGSIASPYLAPEHLVAALQGADKTWIFVGQRGTRYTAETPLGPLTSIRRAPREFTQFAVQAGQWFGITNEGELWQGALTDGQGRRANVSGRLFDFALAENGAGMAIAAPERLWYAENGVDWRPLDAGPFGARSISVDEHGMFTLSAVLARGEVSANGITFRTTGATSNTLVRLRHVPRAYPEAQGLIEGRTAQLGKELLELRNLDGNWFLARSPLDGAMAFSRVEGLDECTGVRFAAFGASSLVLCAKSPAHAEVRPLTLLTANGNAVRFRAVSGKISGKLREVRVVAAGASRFLVTGACSPDATKTNTRSTQHEELLNSKPGFECRPGAPVVIELRQARGAGPESFSMTSVPVVNATTTAAAVAASADGTRLAFVAHGPKSPWRVFLSTDSAKTFAEHSIDELPVTGAPPRSPNVNRHSVFTNESREILAIHFGEDQSLSLVYRDGDAPIIANFDSRGDLVATAMAPAGVSRADASGSRILGFSRTESNVYESLDRGASFELVDHLPGPACLSWLECQVSCTADGCLIGERFTRVGWGGRGAQRLDLGTVGESEPPETSAKTDLVSFRTPVSCEMNSKLGTAGTLMQFAPLPEQVSLAESVWLSPWQDWPTASAGAYRVIRGSHRVEKTTAFAPLAHAEHAGIAFNFNDAGLAYLRSENLPKLDEPMGALELAWMPSERRTWAHARFRDVMPLRANDTYLYGIGKARKLLPEVLTVSGDDALVQVHADDEHKLGTYFLSNGRAELLPRVPWPFATVRDPHWLKVDNAWRVYAFDDTGAELLRGLGPSGTQSGAWRFSAQTVVEPFGARHSIEERVKAYFPGNQAYLVLGFTARGRQLQSLHAHDLGANEFPLGPATHLQLPASLGEPPPACGPRDRRELKRVVVPLLPVAARALGFTDSKGRSHWLVVSRAVMYASEKRACVDALWAETLPGMTPIRAVVPLDDAKHAWMFVSNRVGGETHVEALPVECGFDAAKTPAPEFETRTQARFNLEHLPLE